MIHSLKIESEFFKKIVEGTKTFEVRKNDRNFQVGDYLGLNEVTLDPSNLDPVHENGRCKETGDFVLVKVLDVFSDPRFVKDGFVIMSIRPCTVKETDWDYAPWYTRSGNSKEE